MAAAAMMAACTAQADDWVSLSQYERATGGRYVSEEVVCSGTNLHVSSEMGSLMVQLNVSNEMLQRSLLGRGVAIAISPEGKKSENIEVVFPAARFGRPQPPQGEDGYRQGPPQGYNSDRQGPPPSQGGKQGSQRMPRAGAMLKALNERGASLVIGTDTIAIPKECARISMDSDSLLSLTAVVPMSQISLYTKLGKKWKFGVISPEMDFGERPERGQRPEVAPSGPGSPGSPGGPGSPGSPGAPGGPGGMDLSSVTDTKLEKALTKEINDWTTIKYSDFNR